MALILAFLLAIPPSTNTHSTFPGDLEFTQRDYPAAIAAYESALNFPADSAAVCWRLARVQICLGDVAPDDRCEVYYRKAEELARISLRIDSTQAEAHTWLAVALGSLAVFEGSKAKVRLCNEIKHHLDIAIALNPDDDVAYSILGSFYAALGNVSWIERQLARVFIGRLPDGGYEEAETAFRKAISLAPTMVRHHFALALLYKSEDRPDDARAEFQRVTTLPLLLARDAHDQQLARQWLKEHS